VIGAKGQVYGSPRSWQTSLSYRYQHSDRRFRGSQEAPDPHTAVNSLNILDLAISYELTARDGIELVVPIVEMTRELSVRAGQTFGGRFSTQARGLGDVSISARRWLFDPVRHLEQNISLGLGVKIPTGKDDATDTFETFGAPVVQTVDQSIQPGDGGWGIDVEAAAFKTFGGSFTLVSTLNYLINPEGTNGVPTYRPRASEAIMSVPDQYLARLGIQFPVWSKLSLSGALGARIEGVPAHDLIGPSTGFRRPGYALSIEPGLALHHASNALTVSVPVAVHRDRTQSVPDEIDAPIPPTLGNGDAAFADYVLLVGISHRF
jgi:outer membrane putative beta-barrel porin/alpha-amylase